MEFEAGYGSDTKFGTVAASALDGDNRTDNEPLSMIPAHKASITAGYRFLATGLMLGGRMLLVATQDEKPQRSIRRAPTASSICSPPGSRSRDRWRLDVGINNPLDHTYRRLSWDSGASPSRFYNVGRNVTFALRTQVWGLRAAERLAGGSD